MNGPHDKAEGSQVGEGVGADDVGLDNVGIENIGKCSIRVEYVGDNEVASKCKGNIKADDAVEDEHADEDDENVYLVKVRYLSNGEGDE